MNMVFVLAVVILQHCAYTTDAQISGKLDKKCPAQFCRNGGTCKWMDNGLECDCTDSFTGKHCDTPEADPCTSSPCQNGGACTKSTGTTFTCLCTAGWTGNDCSTVESCQTNPCQNGGVCSVASTDYTCTCASGWLGKDCTDRLVQQNLDGSTFFQKTWAAYKAGFGDVGGNYWLGNDQLHTLTATGLYKMRFDLQYLKDGLWRYAEYSTFTVEDEADMYRLSFTGYSGNATDWLTYSNGQAFSTEDQDNSLASCAAVGSAGDGAGFWYGDCGNVYINSPKSGGTGAGFIWINFALGFDYVDWKLITSRMTLIRK